MQTQLSYRKRTWLSTAISSHRPAPVFISRVFDSSISFRYPANEKNTIPKAVASAVSRSTHCWLKEKPQMTEKQLADCPRCGAELVIERA
jgi:hypothetical protein